jgi:hypothetical protein
MAHAQPAVVQGLRGFHTVTADPTIPQSLTTARTSYKNVFSRCRWFTPVIPATQKAEIRRIMVQSQPRQIVHETLSRKTLHKNRAGGVAQGEGSEFKPQYHKMFSRGVR